MRPILVTLLLLTSPLLASTAQAMSGDAGTSTDAGSTAESALPVPFGTFEGSVLATDRTDVFRLDVPAGAGVRILITPLTGSVFAYTFREGWNDRGAHATNDTVELHSVAYTSPLYLGIHQKASGTYRVELSPMPRDDLAIARVDVTPADPLGLRRDILVDVVNHGAGHSRYFENAVKAEVHHADGSVRHLGWVGFFQLAPGETRTFTFTWDTPGELGDVRLVIDAVNPQDEVPADNRVILADSILIQGDGFDGLNNQRELEAGGVHARMYWWSWTTLVPGAWFFSRVDTPYAYVEATPLSARAGFPVLDSLLS